MVRLIIEAQLPTGRTLDLRDPQVQFSFEDGGLFAQFNNTRFLIAETPAAAQLLSLLLQETAGRDSVLSQTDVSRYAQTATESLRAPREAAVPRRP